MLKFYLRYRGGDNLLYFKELERAFYLKLYVELFSVIYYVQNEDRRDTYGTLIMDRRGSVVPPSSERRGSIFLDPSRQPGLLIDKLKIGFLPGKSVFTSTSKSEDKLEFGSKFNPLYNEEEKVRTNVNNKDLNTVARIWYSTLKIEKLLLECGNLQQNLDTEDRMWELIIEFEYCELIVGTDIRIWILRVEYRIIICHTS